MYFFLLPGWALALILVALDRRRDANRVSPSAATARASGRLREPFGVLQGALLGVVGLILAFGLTPRGRTLRGRGAPRSSTRPTRSERPTCARRPWPSRLGAGRSRCCGATPTQHPVSQEVPGSTGQRRTIAAERRDPAETVAPRGRGARRARRSRAHRGSTSTASTATFDAQTRASLTATTGCPAPFWRSRSSARPSRSGCSSLYLRPRPRPVHRAARRRARDAAATRHLRPRPTDPRSDHRPGHAARCDTRLDGATARGRRAQAVGMTSERRALPGPWR